MTWEELFTDALYKSGLVGQGQIVNASAIAQAKTVARLLLDEWDGAGLALPAYDTSIKFNTVTGQSLYLLGGPIEGGSGIGSLTVGTGLKTITLSDSGTLAVGQNVTLSATGFSENSMTGKVTVYLGGILTVNVTSYTGSGNYEDWDVTINTIRPESIINAYFLLAPTQRQPMFEMDFREYLLIQIPSNQGQPWNYSINYTYPLMELYLYNCPSQVWEVTLSCKVKWVDSLGDIYAHLNTIAQLPSGYLSAFADNLALKLAQRNRLETDTLVGLARDGRFSIQSQLANQTPISQPGAGIWPINVLYAGINPVGR